MMTQTKYIVYEYKQYNQESMKFYMHKQNKHSQVGRLELASDLREVGLETAAAWDLELLEMVMDSSPAAWDLQPLNMVMK